MAATPGHSSLQMPKVAPGQPYGAAGQQAAALHAVPMPSQPQQGPVGEAAGPTVVGLGEPTQNPQEPVTAGAPIGPGPGPEVLPQAQPTGQDPVRQQVAALYRIAPNTDLLRLLELLDAQGR